MADIIDLLQEQHRRMFTLLDLLEKEVAAFSRGEPFDPYVVEGVLDYVAVYPDRLHRPIELCVYETMQHYRGGGDPVSTRAAEAEHATLAAAARELVNAIVAVSRNAAPPRAFVAEKAERFIAGLRQHMTMEEERVFPIARETLTAEDHAAIARRLAEDPEAPALAEEEQAFARLHRTLLRQRDLGLSP